MKEKDFLKKERVFWPKKNNYNWNKKTKNFVNLIISQKIGLNREKCTLAIRK